MITSILSQHILLPYPVSQPDLLSPYPLLPPFHHPATTSTRYPWSVYNGVDLWLLRSALDAESEYLVQDALEKLMFNRTVLTIAHRLSTIKTAHHIAVLDRGNIAEMGSYRDLITIEDGIFRKLVERQTIVS